MGFEALSLRLVRQLFPALGEMVLTSGIVEVGQEVRSFLHQGTAAAQEIPGGAHLGWIDRGLREHPPRSKTAILWASILSFLALPP
jgi:hypothetical protein